MSHLYCISDNRPTPPPASFSERQLARHLLLRLNPQREGDLIPLVGTPNTASDLDAVLHWLNRHRQVLDWPWQLEQCYERILNDINCHLLP
jgi:hypothetical protein